MYGVIRCLFIQKLKYTKMKLLRITQYGFYTAINDEKYIAINISSLAKYINAFLIREYGNRDYTAIIQDFIRNEYYYFGKIDTGLGDTKIEIIGDIEIV